MNQHLLSMFSQLEQNELVFIKNLIKDLSEEDQVQYMMMYQSKRRDTTLILITTLVGLFGFAGIHRFITGQIGMGILYFFTGGLCFIGTIVDLINYKSMAFEYNQKVAYESLDFIKLMKGQ
jgi:TM2 domain-containing membrane protein YozV